MNIFLQVHPSHPELNPPTCVGEHPDLRRTKRMSATVRSINLTLSELRAFFRSTARSAKQKKKKGRSVGMTTYLAKFLRQRITAVRFLSRSNAPSLGCSLGCSRMLIIILQRTHYL